MRIVLGQGYQEIVHLDLKIKYKAIHTRFKFFKREVTLDIMCPAEVREGFEIIVKDQDMFFDIVNESFLRRIHQYIQYYIKSDLYLPHDFNMDEKDYSFEILEITINSNAIANELEKMTMDANNQRRGEIIEWLTKYDELQRECTDTIEKGRLYMRKMALEEELKKPIVENIASMVQDKLKTYNVHVNDRTGTIYDLLYKGVIVAAPINLRKLLDISKFFGVHSLQVATKFH